MLIFLSKKNIIFSVLLLALMGQSVSAKNMYRWKDEDGNVFFSDKVPPDHVKHRRESLNEKADVLEVVEKQKTKSEFELEQRLSVLRRQQEEIINKQKAHDKVLLSTFRTVDDMQLALTGKMSALDGQRSILQGNLKRLEKQLHGQQKKAAQHERDGRRVPTYLSKAITSSKKQIDLIYAEISRHLEKKKNIREKFEADLLRFAFLVEPKKRNKDAGLKTAEKKAASELGLYICESMQQCDSAWGIAKQFIQTYSSTSIDIETNKIIMSQEPSINSDLSLSVSKMDTGKNKQQLFLDIRCHNSSIGYKLCHGAKVNEIREKFSSYIKAALLKAK